MGKSCGKLSHCRQLLRPQHFLLLFLRLHYHSLHALDDVIQLPVEVLQARPRLKAQAIHLSIQLCVQILHANHQTRQRPAQAASDQIAACQSAQRPQSSDQEHPFPRAITDAVARRRSFCHRALVELGQLFASSGQLAQRMGIGPVQQLFATPGSGARLGTLLQVVAVLPIAPFNRFDETAFFGLVRCLLGLGQRFFEFANVPVYEPHRAALGSMT